MKRLARAFLIGAPVVCAACSSTGATPAASGDAGPAQNGAGAVSCGVTTDTYVANLTKPGKLGKYTFTLVQGVPAPPDLDGNVWTIQIVDASGASPTLAQVMAYPYMPQMGHSSDQTPQVAVNADGTFSISDIYLFMPGLWTDHTLRPRGRRRRHGPDHDVDPAHRARRSGLHVLRRRLTPLAYALTASTSCGSPRGTCRPRRSAPCP